MRSSEWYRRGDWNQQLGNCDARKDLLIEWGWNQLLRTMRRTYSSTCVPFTSSSDAIEFAVTLENSTREGRITWKPRNRRKVLLHLLWPSPKYQENKRSQETHQTTNRIYMNPYSKDELNAIRAKAGKKSNQWIAPSARREIILRADWKQVQWVSPYYLMEYQPHVGTYEYSDVDTLSQRI